MFEIVLSLGALALKPVVDLALDKLKDGAADWVTDWLGERATKLLAPNTAARAVALSCATFVREFEAELIGCGETEAGVKAYQQSLIALLSRQEVRRHLGAVLYAERAVVLSVDAGLLAQTWEALPGDRLTDGFRWSALLNRYANTLSRAWDDDDDLRPLRRGAELRALSTAAHRAIGVPVSFDLGGLAQRLQHCYGSVKLEVLDPSPDHVPVALADVFVEPHVRSALRFSTRAPELPTGIRRELIAHPEEGINFGDQDDIDDQQLADEQRRFFAQPSRPVFEVLQHPERRRCVILGDPGSGKSAMLTALALRWADVRTRGDLPIPLFIELKHYASVVSAQGCNDFLQYLDHAPGTLWRLPQVEVAAMLAAGDACLLLDGLDEVFDVSVRRQIVNDIGRYGTTYPRARIVLTSRLASSQLWLAELRGAGFDVWVLQELDERQQDCFVERWHAQAYADAAEGLGKAASLKRSLAETTSLRDMAGNPLLLTLLALLNRHRELPRDRNALFERASALLLEQWDVNKALRQDPSCDTVSLDVADKQAILRALAQHMQSDEPSTAHSGNAIEEPELRRIVRDCLEQELGVPHPHAVADRLVRQLRERSFLLCTVGAGTDVYAFVHRSFLEYFCASAWVWRFKEVAEDRRISLEALRQATFDAHWDDERWSEVLRLIASRLASEDAQRTLLHLLGQPDRFGDGGPVWLAASCMDALRHPARLPDAKARLAQALTLLLDEGARPAQGLRVGDFVGVRARALAALSRLCRGEQSTREVLVARAQDDAACAVRVEAMNALARDWMPDASVVRLLQETAVTDADPDVRLAALRVMADTWTDRPDVGRLLETAACSDLNAEVRAGALGFLFARQPARPETMDLLKARIRLDEQEEVRESALRALGALPHLDFSVRALVRQVAATDASERVRRSAIDLLSRPDGDEAARDAIERMSATDPAATVRQAACRALARRWPDDRTSELLDAWVGDAAGTAALRCEALKALVRAAPSRDALLPRLQRIARNDQSAAMRCVAVDELTDGWKGNDQVQALLEHLVRHDGDADVRRVALTQLASAWATAPGTSALLAERLREDADSRVRSAAAQSLSVVGVADPGVAQALADRTLADTDPAVQEAALDGLLHCASQAPLVADLLRNLVASQCHARLRRHAARQLARLRAGDAQTFSLLLDLATTSEPDEALRCTALQEIARQWPGDSRSCAALQAASRDDPHWSVRRAAVQELAHGWRHDAHTLTMLQDRARADTDAVVRRSALHALTNLGLDRPGTHDLMFDLAVVDADTAVRRAALHALTGFGEPSLDTQQLLIMRASDDRDPAIRQQAIHELRRAWPDLPVIQGLVQAGSAQIA